MRTAMAERLAKFGLELHPEKTRVLLFGRYARKDSERDGRNRPETFDFLGFTPNLDGVSSLSVRLGLADNVPHVTGGSLLARDLLHRLLAPAKPSDIKLSYTRSCSPCLLFSACQGFSWCVRDFWG